jgi:hypothetical protein
VISRSLGQLDHMHGPARTAPFLHDRHWPKFPDRHVTRTADRVEQDAGPRFTAVAFNFEPAIAAVGIARW